MMFDRLIALSQGKTREKRRDLLVMISELFTDGAENYTDAETRLFGDVLCRLVDQVSVDVRAQFSERMAPLTCTPHAVALRLASDEDGAVCEAFGTWVEKQNYGRTYMGIERSTFLFGADGKLAQLWRKVRVKGHADAVLEAAKAL